MATIGHYYIKSCISAAAFKGVDTKALMMMAGIAPSSIAKKQRVTDHCMATLLNYLIEHTQDAFFGFSKQAVPPKFYQLLLSGVVMAKTVEQAITTLQTALALAGCQLEMRCEEKQVCLSLSHQHDDPAHFLQEYLMVFVHRLLCWLANKTIVLNGASVAYEPADYQMEFALLFRCQTATNQTQNAIYFDESILLWPVLQAPESIYQVIEQFPLIVLRFPESDNALDQRVYGLLKRYFTQHSNLPDANYIAHALNMSSATLRRQLGNLETSFSQLKTEFRQEQAMRLLRNPQNTIEDIASQLDYSEARAFSRVFKQWTELTPSQYRQLFLP
ncbi:AraC family transcriptional regulator [Psychrobium sp. MM17-31]|uniref:AraC family transcriptional regulator n=1 Tax=Psychrobium sp. MM17-31 TaxID=2917758 RepID=UPI001EF5ACD7|nr:AraC family transcriptional regulator [Psychrobium sp. MM17-31]MCG7533115.1 AraC family transcriptional regulator [Psychrobium sp. MM17-31]